ncbi:MAG: ABC transporter substrate-binding protein [Gammaproteobacteria bacterium]|nr:ABC transporter substrate-binding protein [Gammaproteobacteria bacterium]MYG13553.1 ABC transporter substrate-binding protein [Gammaproteobacteria bacterium]MYK28598.1 ABC transporter substrate-binding protein [Gammaproteobacteria bacterium]
MRKPKAAHPRMSHLACGCKFLTHRPLFWLAATALLLVGGCGSEDVDENRPLRVQVFTGAYSSMPVHVAVEKGFFQQQGLEVARLPANSSSAAIAALIGGSMDVVESAPDLVLANIDKGIDLKYLVGNESTNYVTLVVGNHVPLSEHGRDGIVRQLAGRRIGVNAIGSTVYLAAVLMLEEAGLAVEDVDFVATGSAATTLSSWQTGAVDAQMTFAPVPELLETLGLARPALVLADDGPPALQYRGLYAGWVANGELIGNQPARADAFIAAMRDAIDWIREPLNHAEMLELARRYAPVAALSEAQNKQVMDRMVRNYRRYWGYRISPAAIDLWNAYALRFNLIGERIPFADVVYAKAPTCTGTCQ